MPSDPQARARLTSPGGLAYQLRVFRTTADLSGVDLAHQLGFSASKVSRIESGHTWPSIDDIKAWCRACDATDYTDRLIATLIEERATKPDWATRLQGGHLSVSRAITGYLTSAHHVTWWEIDVIPGCMQTAEYALPIITNALERNGAPTGDAFESATERGNQIHTMVDGFRTFDVFIGEPALTWSYADDNIHSNQLHRLLNIAALPNVTLGVVPCEKRLPDVLPNPFAMFDDTVVVEDITGEHVIVRDVDNYRAAADFLRNVAANPNVSVDLIKSAIRRLW